MSCERKYLLVQIFLFTCDMVLSNVSEKYFLTLDNYKLDDVPLEDIDMIENNWTIRKCAFMCNQLENCQTVTVKKDRSRCKLFSVSVFAIGSTPVKDNNWQTLSTPGWHPVVKYSSGNSDYNGNNPADFYTTENYNASFPDDICGVDPAQKCNRTYKHTLQSHLLSSSLVKEIKVSVYKDGVEEAWVTFAKNLGDDDWFKSIRVLDSYPWNTAELQASTTFYGFSFASEDMFWLISEGYKHNSGLIGRHSAHAHWLVYKTSHYCDLMADTELPVILYSKESGPGYLATQDVGFVEKIAGSAKYDIQGTEADTVCSDYLHTSLGTWDDVSDANTDNSYHCCAYGWTTNDVVLPSLDPPTPGCGWRAGMNWQSNNVSNFYGAYCKVNHDAVGVADTLVVSYKVH